MSETYGLDGCGKRHCAIEPNSCALEGSRCECSPLKLGLFVGKLRNDWAESEIQDQERIAQLEAALDNIMEYAGDHIQSLSLKTATANDGLEAVTKIYRYLEFSEELRPETALTQAGVTQ